MRVKIEIVLVLAMCLLPVAASGGPLMSDMVIISEVLKNPNANGTYTVVRPMTSTSRLGDDTAQLKKYLHENLKAAADSGHIDHLVDVLIERNKESVKLAIESSPKDGFVIDYDGRFKKYFEAGGGGWERWYKENPEVWGWTRISLPAYDSKTGLVLIYMGTQRHWLAGAGYLILYEFKEGRLVELGRVMVWIS